MTSVEVRLRPESISEFEEMIALYALDGVEIVNPNDPIYDDPHWNEEERPIKPAGEPHALLYGAVEVIQSVLSDLTHLMVSWKEVETEEVDWMKKWAEGFTGIAVGETLFIHPPWVAPADNKRNVTLLPGMAFGTGSHETTRLSAAALEKWIKQGDRVIDVGSGSGVLSLCAAVLGAGSVLAIENDPKTFSNAQENLSLNSFGGMIRLTEGDLLLGVEEPADMIVANILPPILIQMAPQTLSVLPVEGRIILSGILNERVAEVLQAYQEHYKLLEETSMNEWSALVLERVV